MSASTPSPLSRLRASAVKRRRLAIIAITASIALLAAGLTVTTAVSASADPATGAVSGQVQVENIDGTTYSPAGLDDVAVKAWLLSDDGTSATNAVQDQVTTNASGVWSFSSLTPGSYVFEYDYRGAAANIANTFAGTSGTYYTLNEALAEQLASSDAFAAITDGSTYDAGQVSLNLGNIITGTITANAVHPLPLKSQPITVYREEPDSDGSLSMQDLHLGTLSAANGTYTISNLPSGTFTLSAGGAAGYAPQYWDDEYVDTADDADTFNIAGSGQSAAGFDFALDTGATISGTVKDTSNHALGGIVVTAYTSADDAHNAVAGAPHVTTASNGTYTLAGLAPADYTVSFASATGASVHYLTQYFKNEISAYNADDFTLSLGQKATSINAAMAKAGTITGTVSAPTALGAGDYSVYACVASDNGEGDGSFYSQDCDYDSPDSDRVAGTVNYATGAYSIGNLGAGSWAVYVEFTGPENYLSQFYSNSDDSSDVTGVTVTAAATTAHVDFTLAPGAIVTGTVTAGGSPVAGVTVGAYENNDGTDASQGHNGDADRTATTDSNGHYTINGLDTGDYGIETSAHDTLAPQWFNLASSEFAAQTISLTAPNTSPDGTASAVDFSLQQISTVNGTVSGAGSIGLNNVEVVASLYRSGTGTATDEVEDVFTDSTGHYAFTDLAPGDYLIQFIPNEYVNGYLPSYLHGNPTYRLGVTPGSTQTEDQSLDQGGTYTGVVVDSNGNPLQNVPVYPNDAVDPYTEDSLSDEAVNTDGNGRFTIVGLQPGTTTLVVDPQDSSDSDVNSFLDTEYTGPAVTENSAPVDLGNLVLHQAATFSGQIIGVNGKAVPNVDVVVSPAVAGEPTGDQSAFNDVSEDGGATSDSSGRFEVDGLPAGTYTVELAPEDTGVYGTQFLGGGTDATASTPLVITSEGQQVYKEVRLFSGGAVSGKVTNKATGRALAGAYVQATPSPIFGADDQGGYDSYGYGESNSKGAYVIPGLTGGGYSVTFDQGSTAFSEQDSSVWVPDKTTVKVNASLSPTVSVSGTVLDHNGDAVPNEDVQAFAVVNGVVDPSEDYTAATSTGEDGTYSMQLPPGTYVIYFSSSDASGAVGADVYLGGTVDVSGATHVVVGSHALANQSVTLPILPGSIHVSVTHDNTDPLLGYIQVQRIVDGNPVSSTYDGDTQQVGELGTDNTINNLPSGTYRITVIGATFNPSNTDADVLYKPGVVDNVVVGTGLTDAGTVNLTDGVLDSSEQQAAPVVGSEPTIVETTGLQVGETIHANVGTWDQSVDTYYYHWMRDGKLIAGATGATYQLAPGDAGKHISLAIAALNSTFLAIYPGIRPQLNYTTVATDAVANGAPADVVTAPAVTGALKVGSTLTVTPGTWDLPGLTYSYAWSRTKIGSSPVVVSTSATYKATTADVWDSTGQASLSVVVTAKRAGFDPATATVNLDQVIASKALKQTKVSKVTVNLDGSYTVSAGTWSPTGGTISYQWVDYASGATTGTPITGATSATLAVADVPADQTRLTVLVTDVKAGYATTTYEIAARAGEQTSFTGTPALVAGTVWEPGHAATVDPATLATAPANATYAYQWFRAGTAISGAAKASYLLTSADVNKAITVTVTATAPGHPASTAALITGDTVTASGAFDVVATSIDGSAKVGRTLIANISGWQPAPTSATYKWFRGGIAIPHATKAAYTVVAADNGLILSVQVTGKRSGLTTITGAPVTTATVTNDGPINVTAPSIPLSVVVGTKVTAVVGKWDVTPSSYTYQWYLNGNLIPAATASTYTPLAADLDNDLSVAVTPVKTGLSAAPAVQSNSVTIGLGAATNASKAPALTVSGKPVKSLKLGQVLATTAGTWPVASLSLDYQWQVELVGATTWVNLDEQTSKTLFLDANDSADFAVGDKYRVVVTATRPGYLTGAPATSAVLAIVS